MLCSPRAAFAASLLAVAACALLLSSPPAAAADPAPAAAPSPLKEIELLPYNGLRSDGSWFSPESAAVSPESSHLKRWAAAAGPAGAEPYQDLIIPAAVLLGAALIMGWPTLRHLILFRKPPEPDSVLPWKSLIAPTPRTPAPPADAPAPAAPGATGRSFAARAAAHSLPPPAKSASSRPTPSQNLVGSGS